MSERSRRGLLGRVLGFAVAWCFAAALYMVLIDITDLPELIVAVAAALLAAAGFELARDQDIAEGASRVRWLARLHRPILRVPADIAVVSWSALRQLRRPGTVHGEFRAVPFRGPEDSRLELGREALAESLGSFAPNTIIIGVDSDRELILGHQLHRSGEVDAIDVLGLG